MMSEDSTRKLTTDEKLNLILAEMRLLNERVASLEARSYDTRPIWERALAEILQLGQQMHGLQERMDRLDERMDRLEARVDRLEARMDERMGRIETAMSKIEVEMGDTRRVLHSSVAQMMRGLYDYDVRIDALEKKQPPAA
jgi:chromosome segregation ATPase